MQKLREWGFPAVLVGAWMLATAYAASFLFDVTRPKAAQPQPAQPAIVSTNP